VEEPNDIATERLSTREQEILEHLAVGRTAKEIARALLIAPRAVERHMTSMRLKMGVRNTTHMISCGFLSGALRVT
jgi:two-component system nitrate/nitrite response regulator NarL